jgi:hypothetical protein
MKLNFSKQVFVTKSSQISFSLILLVLGLYSCSHKIATDKLPATQIVFGHGGGFTGMEHAYALLQDGRIVRIQKDSATQEIVKKIGKKKAATYYADVDSMRLHTWLYNVPGNVYHYIILKKDGKKDNKIVWDGSGNDKGAPANIEEYYKKLRSELPEKKRKKHEEKH